MISYQEAVDNILGEVNVMPSEKVGVADALYRSSAEAIYSGIDLPPFDNSAMDGYALRSRDTVGASQGNPSILTVIEDVRAGYVASRKVTTGTAVRIMTGAPVPAGADAVVKVEDTESCMPEGEKREHVEVLRQVKVGENIRPKGENVAKGDLVMSKGTVIRPQEIGILASLGIAELMVIKRPRIAIVATGDELVDIGDDLAPGKIRNSNSYSLRAQVLKYGGEPHSLGIARDERRETKEKLRLGLDFDMLIVSGGVSVGDYDFVRDVLRELDVEIKFWKVAIKPGKPVAFGLKGRTLVFGLPGNPVSSMITFEQFVRPAILKMAGRSDFSIREVNAVLRGDIEKKVGFRYFLRGKIEQADGDFFVTPAKRQGSGISSSLVLANALIVVPEDVSKVCEGEVVRVQLLD